MNTNMIPETPESSTQPSTITAAESSRTVPAKLPTIAVIGCGWLGLPLATALVESGFPVVGTTTTPEKLPQLRANGINPILYVLGDDISLMPKADLALLASAEVFFINIPPSGARSAGPSNSYLDGLDSLLQAIPRAARQIIFCSTTSVYADTPGISTEDDLNPLTFSTANLSQDPARHGTPRSVLIAAEKRFAADPRSVILRLSGLLSEDRHPIRFLSGRTNLSQPLAPVNLIHRDDIIDLVQVLIRRSISDNMIGTDPASGAHDEMPRILNVCADEHPSRRDYYMAAARARNLPLPEFDASDTRSGKCIDNTRMRIVMGRPILLR